MVLKNLLVGQSGGPSAAINASLAGVLAEGIASEKIGKVYGAVNGISGVLADHIQEMDMMENEELLHLLKITPAMALGSCRHKLAEIDSDPESYQKIEAVFDKYNIGYFFYIGGNDSMDTVDKLNRYFCRIKKDVKVIGVPKTIDNDLVMTDHTPGFGSAAKYLAVTVDEIIRDTSIYAVKSVTIMEIMGRDSGWLTLAAALPKLLGGSKPDIVALPEVAFDENAFLEQINTLFQTTNNIVAVVSEGIRDQHGNYIGEDTKSGSTDIFGHQYLSGVGKYLEQLIHARIGCKVRSIEVNLMQRCAAHLASQTDLDEAEQIGRAAVKRALEGVSGEMMIFRRVSDHPYQIEIDSYPIGQIANKAAMVPDTMLDLDNSSCREKAADYLLPLIQGDVPQIKDENGMPKFFIL
ncbi:MAG: 6-phosphofructokinase [Clostridiales bacterium]|nr:6-phosphofructokinase [Clostridiales bacterium]